MIHAAIAGSLERFISILLEHTSEIPALAESNAGKNIDCHRSQRIRRRSQKELEQIIFS